MQANTCVRGWSKLASSQNACVLGAGGCVAWAFIIQNAWAHIGGLHAGSPKQLRRLAYAVYAVTLIKGSGTGIGVRVHVGQGF